jgi:hypothetical protein
MNWKRVWIGAALGAVVFWLFEVANLILMQRFLVPEPNLQWSELFGISGSLIFPSLISGLLLSWLYVLARPRLGPGPKTALVMGSIGFIFANPNFFSWSVWMSYPVNALIQTAIIWLKFAAATYIAGWQYIEKAP